MLFTRALLHAHQELGRGKGSHRSVCQSFTELSLLRKEGEIMLEENSACNPERERKWDTVLPVQQL